jgi:short-subunit dehydrogenase
MESKVIVITGASEGIGAATARLLGAAGNKLILSARRNVELESVAAASGEARTFVGDMSKREEVEQLMKRAISEFGKIDVWINNVGRGIDKGVLDLSDADVDEMILLNVKTALYGMQAIIPHFLERRSGQIINISSFLGRVPFAPNRSIYSAAKAALNSLTASIRMDMQRRCPEISISLVMPGLTKTNFPQNALGSGGPSAVPPGTPIQTAEEVAAAIQNIILHPHPELITNPILEPIAQRYCQDVAAFEEELLKK